MWEWDLPKKKGKKKKADKGDKTSGAEKPRDNGSAANEEYEDSEESRPQSRAAKVEEVEDEDAPGVSHK